MATILFWFQCVNSSSITAYVAQHITDILSGLSLWYDTYIIKKFI